jgi:hypothetical protein
MLTAGCALVYVVCLSILFFGRFKAGERRISELVKEVGFKQFRRATHAAFNLIYESKP